MQHKVTAQIGSTQVSIETGKIAKLADGSVIVSSGETMVLASAVSATQIKEGQDWFPLTVDYREKAAAVGKFPGGYFKREGRPSEKETLTSRMTDRPLRPLFPQGYFYDTQIISILLSADGENDPDILAINGASAALSVSDIPFAGPIGAVRVGRVNGQFVANPTHNERQESDLDLVYVGTENDVIMIEGAANEIPEADFVKALEFAHAQTREMIRIQKELASQIAKPKREMPLLNVKPELLEIAYQVAGDRIEGALYTPGKVARAKAVEALREDVKKSILEKHSETDAFSISQAFDHVQKKAFRKSILEKQKRMDGRGYQDLRQITCEVGVIPRAHGSSIFQRGETQALALVTEHSEDRQLKRYELLTDIIGSEDHFGDMDFKLCGTDNGVTGFQLDLKLPGVSHKIMAEAITRAKEARTKILQTMRGSLDKPRAELSKYAPRIETIKINPEKIGALIGPGGKTIKGIVAETGAEINIEDDGSVHIYATSGESMARAKEIIGGMAKEIEIGTTYQGRVVSTKEFGAFVEVLPGKDGLVHISELADFRVKRTEDVVKIGDMIWVKCIGIDDKGRVKLSRKAALKERAEKETGQPAPAETH